MNRRCFVPLLLLLGVAGCGGRSTSDYHPPSDQSKQALTIALDAWKNGGTPDPAGKLSSGVTVIALDMDWSSGQKLASYEIGPEVPADAEGPRKISVKLAFADGRSIEATYFIVGIDPVRVFRDKNYDQFNQL